MNGELVRVVQLFWDAFLFYKVLKLPLSVDGFDVFKAAAFRVLTTLPCDGRQFFIVREE